MALDVQAQIEKAVRENEVLLFMKGTRSAPSCGFSAKTVEVLDSLLGTYATIDVLTHPEIRAAIKEYSSWPTIPQLYVRGEFVGGADIVAQMFESGELHGRLGVEAGSGTPPTIRASERALQAFREFLSGSDEVILLEIDRSYQSYLSLGPRPESAVFCEVGGLTFALDKLSAGRAEGLFIDYVDTPEGSAFKLDNPGEPAKVRPLAVRTLKQKMDRGDALRLIDVRRPDEWEKARIAGAELLDSDLMDELLSLPLDTTIVLQCHHGHRSQRAAEQLCAQGYKEVYNLTGGIDAWSLEIDPAVPRY